MKKHLSTLILLLILAAGVCLMLYPMVSDRWNARHQSRAIDAYSQSVAELEEAQYAALWQSARAYNRSLPDRGNGYLLTQKQKTEYESLLNTGGNGIMGYVEIPVIDCLLPIYHGTGEGVLQVAVGHLEWSSLPVGGESSHCVLSGHRGLPSARLFTDLDQLTLGDRFRLHVLNESLTYQIDQILTVEPEETEELEIRAGEDLCTLVTCTPYGINSHRLLVRGRRVEETEPMEVVTVAAEARRIAPETVGAVLAVPVLLGLMLYWLLPFKRKGGETDETV